MGTEDGPMCLRHPDHVRMLLRTLHSDRSAPHQVLAVYVCPECGSERRLPIPTRPVRPSIDEQVASRGAA